MLLHEGLTHIHSQKKARLHFGESFTLNEYVLAAAWTDVGIQNLEESSNKGE